MNLSSLYRRIRSLMTPEQEKQWEARIIALVLDDEKVQHQVGVATIELSQLYKEIAQFYKEEPPYDTISLTEALKGDCYNGRNN